MTSADETGRGLDDISLPIKVFLGIILIAAVTWTFSDYYVSVTIRRAFETQLSELLEEKAFQHRVRFTRFVESYPQAVQMLTSQAGLGDYIDRYGTESNASEGPRIVREPPPWLRDFSFFREFLVPGYGIMFDAAATPLEVYQTLPVPPPAKLLDMDPLTLDRTYGQMHIGRFNGSLFLVASDQVFDRQGGLQGTLMLATPLDDVFLIASNGPATDWNQVALVTEDEEKILVSNSPTDLPAGRPLGSLKGDFLFTEPKTLALGGMELHFKFASFVRRNSAEALTGELQRSERVSHLLVTTFHVLPFVVIITWLTRRITRLTGRIETFSRKHSERGGNRSKRKGDQFTILEERFQQLLNDVEQRTAELEAANGELEAFAYSISHDLRAPLRSIDGFSHALVEDYGPALEKEAHEYLQRIRDAAQRMGLLIDDLLMLSRVNRAEMKRIEIDLSGMAQKIMAELRQENPEREAEIIFQPGLKVSGDERLIWVALYNLLDNAWKYSSRKPLARIEFGMKKADRGLTGTAPEQSVFFVSDNGAGFNMAYADKLFTPFQRLHLQNDFPGNGVGLATVQRVIRRHGGLIWAEATEGEGATFFFALP